MVRYANFAAGLGVSDQNRRKKVLFSKQSTKSVSEVHELWLVGIAGPDHR
jgi:hypothetical protein